MKILSLISLFLLGAGMSLEADILPDYSTWPVINVKTLGAVGNGVADDSKAFAAALKQAGLDGKAVVLVPAGAYLLNTPTASSSWGGRSTASLLAVPNAQVVIKGDGAAESRLITTKPATVFEGYGATNAQLTLLNLAIQCQSGYTSVSNSFGIVFSGTSLQAQGVQFRNFTQAIRVPENLNPQVGSMYINECQFLYDHGRAGVAQNDTTNQYPVTSILGGGTTTIILRSSFNGLVDPTFKSTVSAPLVSGVAPGSQYTPVDGMIKTICQVTNARIQYCSIKNNGVEAILLDGDRLPGGIVTKITNNSISGPNPQYVTNSTTVPAANTMQTHSGFYLGFYPGIAGTNLNGIIANNSIVDTSEGINVGAVGGYAGKLVIGANLIQGCLAAGIDGQLIPNLTIANNVIAFGRAMTALERAGGNAASEKGLYLDGCPNAAITANQIVLQSDQWWTGQVTLLTDAAPSALILNVSAAIPVGTSVDVYLSDSTSGAIWADGAATASGQIQLNNPLSRTATYKAGTVLNWTTGVLGERAAVCIYHDSGSTQLSQNTLSGGINAIVHLENSNGSSITSTGDTFLSYLQQPPVSAKTIVQNAIYQQ